MDWSKAGDANQTYMSDMPDLSHDEISCKDDVLLVFPDICPDYLAQLAIQHNYQPGMVLSAIVDTQEKTGSYPTQISPESNPLKRKRGGKSNDDVDDGSDSSDEGDPECVRSIKLQIAAPGYPDIMRLAEYAILGKNLLSQEFPRVPQSYIRASLQPKKDASNKSVFETYTEIAEQIRNWDNTNKPWQEKKTLTKANPDFAFDKLRKIDMSGRKPGEQAAFAEFVAAKQFRAIKDAKIAAEAEEQNNFLRAKNEGQTIDCGICFEECPLNRMVRCDGEIMHWFCRKCLRTQAESLIGMAKYELTCMSLDGCSAGFSRGQKKMFLGSKLAVALDRIEQEAVLRMAGIENLETCPFCPYAAEYPPVEVDKEFRCEDPRCRRVSCRLCRKETHIPRTCAEVEADRGLDARHALEEAKSEALIRRCNNCQNPFIKIDGCNKVRCTKCMTLQCDVCRKTITSYSHFNDTTRGGKTGQCPLYDESRGRYEKEVSSAETEMLKKIVTENPDLVNAIT
ncbi:hypothetical protein F4803DRAFT_562254 [Xylaria telfairii]|nr:hypothetical protein F4803DRAFT_562254 [Xylaria telfairii]